MLFILVDLWIFLIFVFRHLNGEGTLHQRLIFGGDLSRGSTVHAVSIIAAANQKRAKCDGKIETIARLPIKNVCRRGNYLWELVRYLELLIFQEISDKLGALVPFVELSIRQLGWSEGRADEFRYAAFIARGK